MRLAIDDASPGEGLYLGIHYEDLQVNSEDASEAVLTGDNLDPVVRGDGTLLPAATSSNASRSLGFTVDELPVPNLARLQRYLPPHVPLIIRGGVGTLDGQMELRRTALPVDLSLQSDSAGLSLRDLRFATNLAVVLKLDNPDLATPPTAVGGSYLRFSDSHIGRQGQGQSATWNTDFSIDEG